MKHSKRHFGSIYTLNSKFANTDISEGTLGSDKFWV